MIADNTDPQTLGNILLNSKRPGESLTEVYDRLFGEDGHVGAKMSILSPGENCAVTGYDRRAA